MKLGYKIVTETHFGEAVKDHVFRLRALPMQYPGQQVLEATVRVEPEPTKPFAMMCEQPFGNRVACARIDKAHDTFRLECEGTVERDESAVDNSAPAPYLTIPTRLTAPDERIIALSEKYTSGDDEGTTATALALMSLVHKTLEYKPGSTNTFTTAAQALKKGCGVCQDFSHLLISLLRLRDIPCLYVSGLVVGTGATHAWVRAWVDGHWIDLDPTHDRACDGTYITLARGCDFTEACIERGVFRGQGDQWLLTQVSVSLIEQ